jgi:hypothetical protein
MGSEGNVVLDLVVVTVEQACNVQTSRHDGSRHEMGKCLEGMLLIESQGSHACQNQVTPKTFFFFFSFCMYNETLRPSPPAANEELHIRPHRTQVPSKISRCSPDKYGLVVIDAASPEGGCIVDEMLLMPATNRQEHPRRPR